MLPPQMLVMGNGQNNFYSMNGAMIENFPFTGYPEPGCPYNYSWQWDMFGRYGYFANEAGYNPSPARIDIINTKWIYGDRYTPSRSSDFERRKRFTLVSCMLGDGFYSLDWFDQPGNKKAHHSLWWEAEYDKPIGNPVGPPYQVVHEGATIWRRDFENGAVIINPTSVTFPASLADSLPLLDAWDARLILNGEFFVQDLTPPSRVTDLRVTRVWADSAEIAWTNAGDDGLQGWSVGMTIRYSAGVLLDDGNFISGMRLLPAVSPESGGVAQTTVLGGFTPGQLYYVALRHFDEEGNVALVSNNAFFVAGNTVSEVPSRPAIDRPALSAAWPNPSAGRVGVELRIPAGRIADGAGHGPRRRRPAGAAALAWRGPRRPSTDRMGWRRRGRPAGSRRRLLPGARVGRRPRREKDRPESLNRPPRPPPTWPGRALRTSSRRPRPPGAVRSPGAGGDRWRTA